MGWLSGKAGLAGIREKDSKSNLISGRFSTMEFLRGVARSGRLWTTADIYASGTII